MDSVTQSAYPEPVPREQMRASDADRQAVVDKLREAHDDGRLTLGEFDERTRSAYAARTYADLMLLTADLPTVPRPPAVPEPEPDLAHYRPHKPHKAVHKANKAAYKAERRTGPLVWRVVGSTWFSVNVVCLLIWGITCVAAGEWQYPWWIWVAGPWGAVLLAGWLSGIGRSRNT